MKSTREVLEKIKSSRRQVTFEPSIKDNEREFTPYAKTKSSPNHTAMKKHTIGFLMKNDLEGLSSYFINFIPKEINDFFKKEGIAILNWAIICSSNPQDLEFLAEKVHKDIINEILENKDFSILSSFLGGQENMEEQGICTETEKSLMVKKIKILLAIGNDEVVGFIQKHVGDSLRILLAKEVIQQTI